jgi:hypothetical protein
MKKKLKEKYTMTKTNFVSIELYFSIFNAHLISEVNIQALENAPQNEHINITVPINQGNYIDFSDISSELKSMNIDVNGYQILQYSEAENSFVLLGIFVEGREIVRIQYNDGMTIKLRARKIPKLDLSALLQEPAKKNKGLY